MMAPKKHRYGRKWLWPTFGAQRVSDISLESLIEAGPRGILIDLDNTLVAFHHSGPAQDDAAWVAEAATRGIHVIMVTNNATPWAAQMAKELGISIIPNARKPHPNGFARALSILEMPKDAVVVIGDQLFTDILGARLFGVRAILVDPLVRSDPWNTRPLRWLEWWVLRGLPKAGP